MDVKMTDQIKSLTEAQIATFQTFVDKWISVGLDTAPLDYAKIRAAVETSYKMAEIAAPRFYVYAKGPIEAVRIIRAAENCTLTENDFVRLSESADPLALTNEILKSVNPDQKASFEYPHFYGQHDAGWLSFYDFFHTHFGIGDQILGLSELAKQAGWVYFYEDLVIICQKPTKVTMRNGRTHNEKGPAIEYADGLKVYSFNGTVIPEKWVMERDTIDPSEIMACTDTDQRAAGIAMFGYDRMKKHLDYKILQGNPDTDIGALIELTIPGLKTKGHFLEAVCPRNGPVFLGVPHQNPFDENRPITNAVAAQAFLAGLPESAYQHPPIRT
jgi:hypothetical protein